MIGTVGNDSSSLDSTSETQGEVAPWSAVERAQTRATVDENV
jgi:hypothetical protein